MWILWRMPYPGALDSLKIQEEEREKSLKLLSKSNSRRITNIEFQTYTALIFKEQAKIRNYD
jgi:hypothetical protein